MSLPLPSHAAPLAWVLLEETCDCLDRIQHGAALPGREIDALRNCFERIHAYVEIRDVYENLPLAKRSCTGAMN